MSSDRIEIRLVEPGPLPFDDGSLDVVFSKDSIVHIADKEWLCGEAFRVLRPGGWFVASDWLIAHDGEPSPEMADYIAAEALDFGMASPARYERALRGCRVRRRRAAQSQRVVPRGRRRRTGTADRPRARARSWTMLGADEVAAQIRTWSTMEPVLESGEHCPHHFRARRPG